MINTVLRTLEGTEDGLDKYTDAADRYYAAADEISRREFGEHPLVKGFKQLLRADMHLILTAWAEGCYTSETCDGTAQQNASALGELHALEKCLDHIQQLEETPIDDNPVGTQDTGEG